MASPITQRVAQAFNKQVVIDQDKLKIGGTPGVEDVVTKINKDLGVTFDGADGGDQYVKDMTAERDKRQPGMDLKKYMKLKDRQNAQAGNTDFQGQENGVDVDATQWSNQDVEYGNREEEQIIKGTEGKPGTDAYLDPEFKTNLTRGQAANQRRREGMLDRSTKRRNKRAYRLLNKQKRKSGSLTPEQQEKLDFLEQNRYTDGLLNNYNKDSSGKITGNKLQDGSSSLNNPTGWTEQTSGTGKGGQTQATLANIERYEAEYGVKPTIVDGAITFKKQQAETGYKQKGYSGYQNPSTPKKQTKLFEIIGRGLGNVANKFSKTKKTKQIDFKSTNTPLGVNPKKITDGKNLPATADDIANFSKKNKNLPSVDVKTPKKFPIVPVVGGIVAGSLGTALLGSSNSNDNSNDNKDDKKDVKTGKSYDQAYKDRDRKTYGGNYYGNSSTGKSNYIKEAKRQNDVFAKTGKWDYKNAPKDPAGPISTIKPAKVAPVSSSGPEIKAPVNLDKISQPERKPTISNKQGKALNKLGKLEGRKQTSRRDIRIAKQKDKAAGLSRQEVRKNKQMRKGNFTTTRTSSGSVTGGQAAVNNFINQNENATIKQREDELKSVSGFRQKGWSGYQK